MSDQPKMCTTSGEPVAKVRAEQTEESGQHKAYVVLCPDERAKGFIKPYRTSYRHRKCGTVTTMNRAISETYARDPYFYSATFCVGCNVHLPLSEFTWEPDGEPMDTNDPAWRKPDSDPPAETATEEAPERDVATSAPAPPAPKNLRALLLEWTGADLTGEELFTDEEWAAGVADFLEQGGVRLVPPGSVVVARSETFQGFSERNFRRCEAPNGFGHPLLSWSLSDWFTALTGELGEAANVAKKLNRIRDGVRGNRESEEELRAKLRAELADCYIYLDLLAQRAGFRIGDAVAETFDAKSREIGYLEETST